MEGKIDLVQAETFQPLNEDKGRGGGEGGREEGEREGKGNEDWKGKTRMRRV